jgi:hypothetical protein
MFTGNLYHHNTLDPIAFHPLKPAKALSGNERFHQTSSVKTAA